MIIDRLKKSTNVFVNGSWYSWPPSNVHIVTGASAHESAAKHPGAPRLGGAPHLLRDDHAAALAQLRRWAWGTALIVALIVLATWDMVFKPGLA